MTPYDQLHYHGRPFPDTHPDHLAAEAILYGLDPPPPARARVLEVGCSDGGNLLGMAMSHPEASLAGIDLAETQIAVARQRAAAAGSPGNLRFEAANLMDMDARYGMFDYIIAHGVYAWVPPQVADRLLAVIAALLSPSGIAYVSYNTYPGARLREISREMLLYHTRETEDVRERARQAMAFLERAKAAVHADPHYAAVIEARAATLGQSPEQIIVHDELAGEFHPAYFSDFVQRARAHGLEYVTEAEHSSMSQYTTGAPRELVDSVARGRIERQQYFDFLRGRMFRQSLLCHRGLQPLDAPDRRCVRRLFAACELAPPAGANLDDGSEVSFHAGNREAVLNDPLLKNVVARLAASWPARVPVAGLTEGAGETAAEAVAEVLLRLHAAGAARLHAGPSPAGRAGERPRTSPLARSEAASDLPLTSLLHESLHIEDRLALRLVELMDGTRDREQLRAALSETAGAAIAAADLNRNLDQLAALGLIYQP